MLAIASLATGFVVAAITPSHGLDTDALGNRDVDDAHSTLDRTTADDALGQEGHSGHEGSGTSRNG
ncbi:hypothetical protein GCM10010344_06630 [Streptomyces bluensis]|nr:hypothetical protein GCM10010344_06630 [Streptomyces bluensis]